MGIKPPWSEECSGRAPALLGLHYPISLNLSPSQQVDDPYSFMLWISILLTFEENKQNQHALYRCKAVICQISFPWILLKYRKSIVCCHSIITLCTFMFTYRVLFSLKAFTSPSVRDAIHFTGREMECRAVTSKYYWSLSLALSKRRRKMDHLTAQWCLRSSRPVLLHM